VSHRRSAARLDCVFYWHRDTVSHHRSAAPLDRVYFTDTATQCHITYQPRGTDSVLYWSKDTVLHHIKLISALFWLKFNNKTKANNYWIFVAFYLSADVWCTSKLRKSIYDKYFELKYFKLWVRPQSGTAKGQWQGCINWTGGSPVLDKMCVSAHNSSTHGKWRSPFALTKPETKRAETVGTPATPHIAPPYPLHAHELSHDIWVGLLSGWEGWNIIKQWPICHVHAARSSPYLPKVWSTLIGGKTDGSRN